MMDSVIIEPISKDDDEGFFRLIDAERARLSTYFPQTTSRCPDKRSTRRYIKEMITSATERELYCFVLRDYEGGDPVGAVFLKQFDWSIPKCETAYFISSVYEGHGLSTLGLIWAADFAFSNLGVNKLYARIDLENTPSVRVAEKCGFEREGLIRHDFRTNDGRLIDVLYYGKVR